MKALQAQPVAALGHLVARVVLLCLACQAVVAQTTTTVEHKIGPGDVLSIRVFGEDDLSPQVKVGEDGTVPYNFLGELQVAGLTTNQVESLIMQGLKGPYLIDPRVAVSIAEYRSVYVYGEVRTPGGYPYEPGLTVRRVLSLAGGMTERASARKIYLLQEGASEESRRRVDLETRLAAGDTITIEESFF